MTKKNERTERAVKFAYEAFANSFICSQSSLRGLMREFMPENKCIDDLEKSAGLLCGVGLRGDTCGALLGGCMFLGILYGQVNTATPLIPEETMGYLERVSVITEYAEQFEKTKNSIQCRDLHKDVMGKYYDLTDKPQLMQFFMDGADKKCQAVVESAVRIACDLILDDNGEIKKR